MADQATLRASEADRKKAHLAALEREKAGYEQRLRGVKAAKDGDEESIVEARLEATKKEIARVKKEGITKGGEPPALGSPIPDDE